MMTAGRREDPQPLQIIAGTRLIERIWRDTIFIVGRVAQYGVEVAGQKCARGGGFHKTGQVGWPSESSDACMVNREGEVPFCNQSGRIFC